MSIAASRYARALLDVLYPSKADAGREQLKKFSSLLAGHPAARVVLENPTLSAERRKELLRALGDSLNLESTVRNFLALLIDRNRLDIFDDVLSAYEQLLDEKMGVVRAKVSSAQELDPEQQRLVAARLESLTGKIVRMEVSVDPGLIGGLVAQVGSTIYDGSLRSRLQSFRNNLIQQ